MHEAPDSSPRRWAVPAALLWVVVLGIGAVFAAPVLPTATSEASSVQAQAVTARDGSDGIVILVPTPAGATDYQQRLAVNKLFLELRALPGVETLTTAYDGDRRRGMIALDSLATAAVVNPAPGQLVVPLTAEVEHVTGVYPGAQLAGASVDRVAEMRAFVNGRGTALALAVIFVLCAIALVLGLGVLVASVGGGITGAVIAAAMAATMYGVWPGRSEPVSNTTALAAAVASVVGMVTGAWAGALAGVRVEDEHVRPDGRDSSRARVFLQSLPQLGALAAIWALVGTLGAAWACRDEIMSVSIGVVAGLVASLLVALPAVSAATPLVSPARYRRRLLRRSHARTDGRGAFGYRWAVHVGTRPWVCVTAGVALLVAIGSLPTLTQPRFSQHVHGGEVAQQLLGRFTGMASGVGAALTHSGAIRAHDDVSMVWPAVVAVVLTAMLALHLTRSLLGVAVAMVCASVAMVVCVRIGAWLLVINDITTARSALPEERLVLAVAAGSAWCMTMTRAWQLITAAHVAYLEGNDSRRAQVLGMARTEGEGTVLAALHMCVGLILLVPGAHLSVIAAVVVILAALLAELNARLLVPAVLAWAGEAFWVLPGRGTGSGRFPGGGHERSASATAHRVCTLDLLAEGDRVRSLLRTGVDPRTETRS